MNPLDLATIVLLFAGIVVIVLSCIGLMIGDAFDRLHYLGAVAMFASLLIGAAVIVRDASTQSVIKMILLIIAVMLASPVLTHATGESGFLRKYETDSKDE